jgi:drug/metabolite transporter (DMT)-like permease
VIYSFLYVLIFSVALVLIQKLDISIPPLFSLLVTASIASIYFNLINLHRLKEMYRDCFRNSSLWILIMSIVLLMWGCTMIGPGKIGASSFNFLYFAWLGTLGFVSLSFQDWKKNRMKFYFGLSILLLIIANIFLELQESFTSDTGLGIFLALAGGTSSFVYFKVSQAFTKKTHLSATQILSVRFYLSIIVLFIILPKHNVSEYLSWNNSLSLVLLAFCSLIIPLYFSQKALEKITSEQHAIINSLCPAVTGVLQEIIFNDLKLEQMVIYLLYSGVIGFSYLMSRFRQKSMVNA